MPALVTRMVIVRGSAAPTGSPAATAVNVTLWSPTLEVAGVHVYFAPAGFPSWAVNVPPGIWVARIWTRTVVPPADWAPSRIVSWELAGTPSTELPAGVGAVHSTTAACLRPLGPGLCGRRQKQRESA